jgi:hypothetical protein
MGRRIHDDEKMILITAEGRCGVDLQVCSQRVTPAEAGVPLF